MGLKRLSEHNSLISMRILYHAQEINANVLFKRGVCKVFVTCLNQDFQDFQIFKSRNPENPGSNK